MKKESRIEQHQRTGRLVEDAYYSSSYSKWNVDKAWSSQAWKSDDLMEDRTGQPVLTEQPSSSSVQEIDKRFLFGCESTNVSVE